MPVKHVGQVRKFVRNRAENGHLQGSVSLSRRVWIHRMNGVVGGKDMEQAGMVITQEALK